MLPVAVNVPAIGSYSSALARGAPWFSPPAMRTFPLGKQRRFVLAPCRGHAAGGRECPGAGIVQFRACEGISTAIVAAAMSTSVAQQRCRVVCPCRGHAAGGRECPGAGIVQFRAREAGIAAADEHLSLSTTLRVVCPCRGHAAGGRECPGHWVVQLRTRESPLPFPNPPAMRTFPPGNKVAVCHILATDMLPSHQGPLQHRGAGPCQRSWSTLHWCQSCPPSRLTRAELVAPSGGAGRASTATRADPSLPPATAVSVLGWWWPDSAAATTEGCNQKTRKQDAQSGYHAGHCLPSGLCRNRWVYLHAEPKTHARREAVSTRYPMGCGLRRDGDSFATPLRPA